MAGICGANAAFRQRQIQPEFENNKEREEEQRAGGLGMIVALILNQYFVFDPVPLVFSSVAHCLVLVLGFFEFEG